MSVQALGWVFTHSSSTGATRCVLLAIANHLDSDGEGWVPLRRILDEANCSLSTYHRSVKSLIDEGELEREVGEGGSLRCPEHLRPNLFRLPALTPDRASLSARPGALLGPDDEVDEEPGGVVNLGTPSGEAPGQVDDLPPGQVDNLPPGQVDDLPIEEPSVEPSKEPLSTDVDDAATNADAQNPPAQPTLPGTPTRAEEQDALGDRGFDEFWKSYPLRNGKKVGKEVARQKWRRLNLADRRLAWRAANRYADAVAAGQTIAKDPPRFLTSGYWRDWVEGDMTTDQPNTPPPPAATREVAPIQ